MFSDIFEDIFQPMFSDLFGLSKICQAIRFNGANNYGQLAQRAINPDGDNVFEFWTPAVLRNFDTIISQNISGAFNLREFQLFSTAGALNINFGGVQTSLLFTPALKPDTKYKLTFIGDQATVYDSDGNMLRTTTFTRGAAREPLALTKVGANTDGSGHSNFFQGLIPYIRINNFYYAMDAVGQAIQPSLPAGNDMTLFNTVPEQWEPISCGLRSQV